MKCHGHAELSKGCPECEIDRLRVKLDQKARIMDALKRDRMDMDCRVRALKAEVAALTKERDKAEIELHCFKVTLAQLDEYKVPLTLLQSHYWNEAMKVGFEASRRAIQAETIEACIGEAEKDCVYVGKCNSNRCVAHQVVARLRLRALEFKP